MVPSRIFSLITVLVAAGGFPTAASEGSETSNGGDQTPLTTTLLSPPIPLFPGEIADLHGLPIKLPKGPIAISKIHGDVVEKDPLTGGFVPVPPSQAYLHHCHMKYNNAIVTTFGADARGTINEYPFPYRVKTKEGDDTLISSIHLINTREMSQKEGYRCAECPCTKEDYVRLSRSGQEIIIDEDDEVTTTKKKYPNSPLLGSIIDEKNWTNCNSRLTEEKNTACSPETYYGGIQCCGNGEFCSDDYYMSKDAKFAQTTDKTSLSVFYMRYNITYTPAKPEIKPVFVALCCDATGNMTNWGNFEYDIPQCSPDDDVCVHELETIQKLHNIKRDELTGGFIFDSYLDVVKMKGHLHPGGISMTAYIESTGEVLCESLPTYGTGERGEIGNDPGYIESMSYCLFDPPRRLKRTELIRIVGKYDSKEAHTGVMSLFKISVANVPPGQPQLETKNENGGFWEHFRPLKLFVVAGIVISATWHVSNRMGLDNGHRIGYARLPKGESLSA